MGRTQAVLSAAMDEMLKNWISDHDLRTFFTDIVGVDNQYAHGKIDIGNQYIEKVDINRKEILMIGDSVNDSEAAKSAGIPMILLKDGYTDRNVDQIYHDHLINDFNDIEKIISLYLND